MTSSLVGSEMCIRDRPFAAGEQVVAASRNWEQLRPLPPPLLSPGHVLPCLLYTSDAADDM
eukprot:7157863-Prorocentrum_lima.AAC.1